MRAATAYCAHAHHIKQIKTRKTEKSKKQNISTCIYIPSNNTHIHETKNKTVRQYIGTVFTQLKKSSLKFVSQEN